METSVKRRKEMGTKVEIISRTTVKPSSPTPAELRNFKLSLLDQIIPPMYGLIVFFYPSEDPSPSSSEECEKKFSDKSSILKESLSKTLTTFYPMAGRTDSVEPSIECSDVGALFVEAKLACKLSDFLTGPDTSLLDGFLPCKDSITAELAEGFVTLVQLTGFECGGTAVSVCLSHKIGDISSLVTFLRSWTHSCDGHKLLDHPPLFVGDSMLPAIDPSFMKSEDTKSKNSVTKRIVFGASEISRLKAEAGMVTKHLSRVEMVLALILKCAVSSSCSVSGKFRPSVLLHAVNLRLRMDPPLPENLIGNLIWFIPVVIGAESELGLGSIVGKIKKLVTEFCDEKASKFKGDVGVVLGELGKWRDFKEMEVYSCSSWCNVPLYETDFGWGKPSWVSSASLAYKNSIILVDTKQGNGIEAWVTLEKEKMAIFENSQELLQSAAFQP